ncbi:alkaline phosphatase PafA [Polaribacter sp.]|jgi:predicted AlkP superfamily pyrophosphatase or phosphodiesterase|uniref:alkaline phosphatase PafA n=1 Tax=Polaribacter sp. TaxID=1920175 RepID=UPI00404778B8
MKTNSLIYSLIFTLLSQISFSQQQDKPKLIVGVVIDQMRAEYLYRFQDNYAENGFKRLLREGFNVKNTHYNYIPTATGPGHTSIYTGTTPVNHGIVSNDWYNRELGRSIYCAEDSTVFLVDHLGVQKDKKFKNFSRSPKNNLTTTITDELKLFTNQRSKVIGVSLKDRGAIFPSGHLANAAYWYNPNNGHFVTSSYYMNKLPQWLIKFNNKKKSDSLLNQTWKTLLPIEKYIHSEIDDRSFEKKFKGKQLSIFPYDLKTLRKENGNYKLITHVPQGNTLLTELVKATIKGENLGRNETTDFLTISYSSTDYVGHNFGIRSKELEDTYIRMDREIALLLKDLDTEVGKDNYILFLTADHAVSDNPPFLKSKRLPGNFYNSKKIKENLNIYLSDIFGKDNYIAHIDKTQIYLSEKKIVKEKILKASLQFLITIEGMKDVFAPELKVHSLDNSIISNVIKNSYNSKESGDILYQMHSGWMEERLFGTTHSTAYTSDTHVPLLWYGWHIPKGETVKPHVITQITPTLSFLLDIPLPNASNREPIKELFD